MSSLINQFWKWAGKTPEEYAKVGMNQNMCEFEDEFPLFKEMIAYSRETVNNNLADDFSVDELLTIMALDNESENVLDYIEENSSDEQVEKIIEIGMIHIQPEARWQLAELIYRRRVPNCIDYLVKLQNDKHPYVSKRARNHIEYLKSEMQ